MKRVTRPITVQYGEERFKQLPEQVRSFVTAMVENGRQAFGDQRFSDSIPIVEIKEDGEYTVSDNYERYFSTIYVYQEVHGKPCWWTRTMYGANSLKQYSYEQAMSDAGMMFTG